MELPPVTRLTEADLTSRVVGGTGLFDGLMATMDGHIRREFESGRITGSDYAKSYVALTQSALSAAVQYSLGRDQAYWQNELLKAQALAADKQRELSDAEINRIVAQTNQITYETGNILPAQKAGIEAETDIKGYQLTTRLPAETALVNAQKTGVEAETGIKNYQLKTQLPVETAHTTAQKDHVLYQTGSILPAQKAGIEAETAHTAARKDNVVYETTAIMPAQKAGIVAETAIKDYQVKTHLPAETAHTVAQRDHVQYQTKSILPAQKAGIDADTSIKGYQLKTQLPSAVAHVDAQRGQVLYETQAILPAQKIGIDKENAIKTYQLSTQLPAQVGHTDAQTLGQKYTNTWLLPAQLDSVREQTEGHRAKTLDVRKDGHAVKGAIGKQKELHQQQIVSYQRDAETKIVKILTDTWTVQKTIDDGLAPPASLTDANINSALDKIRTNLGL